MATKVKTPYPERGPGEPLVRPKEAATVIIYRPAGRTVEVLMGERHRKHRFMPHHYVFPGGRVDPTDSRVRVATPMQDHVTAQLQRKLTEARARATGIAAIREVFEETGLIIGAEDPRKGARPPKGWEKFFATGLAPALDRLEYVARAVTPPIRPVRFDARFFMVGSEHVDGHLQGSGELLDLRWFPIAEAMELELPRITRRVLQHMEEILDSPPPRRPDTLVPYFKHTEQGHIRIDE